MELQRFKDASGLSWEQISRLMGTSVRTVGDWAAGATMGPIFQVRLIRLIQTIGQIPSDSLMSGSQLLLQEARREGAAP